MKKLKPYYARQLAKFIDEHTDDRDDEFYRKRIVNRIIYLFEHLANGLGGFSKGSCTAFFSNNPENQSLSQCFCFEMWISRNKYAFIATPDDFYDSEFAKKKNEI